MLFLDNIIFSLQKIGGISIVWYELIKYLLNNNIPNLKFLEYENDLINSLRKSLTISSRQLIRKNNFNKIFSQFVHPKINSDRPFIFHSSYFRTCKNPLAINITTVHDFIYEQRPMSLKERIRTKLNYNAIRNSQAIICVSENTKKDLLKFVPEVKEEKIYVIHNGVSEVYRQLNLIPYPDLVDSILFVGGRQSYKNFDLAIKIIKNTEFKLLICGAPLTKKEKAILNTVIPNRYKNIIYPSNEELNNIYNSVFCLLYPSSYEGFGIPVLEAQRAGCPVIAMNSSSIPEIIGNKGLIFRKEESNFIFKYLENLKDSRFRKDIIESGLENSKNYSWEKMARQYMALYSKLLPPINNL